MIFPYQTFSYLIDGVRVPAHDALVVHYVDGAVVVVVVLLVAVLGPIWQYSRGVTDVTACTGI